MIILEHPLERVLSIVGRQARIDNLQYRLFNFCLVNDEGIEGKTIFNGLTKSAIHITNDEWKNFEKLDYEFLYNSYILVPKDFDDLSLVNKYKEEEQKNQIMFTRHPTNYTILPTTGCNARCFYCYELGCKHKVMNKETAEKVSSYIIKYCNKTRPIKLHWFGGEPTLNISAIDIICNSLLKNNIQFFSEITSNGYLLNEKNIIKAISLWNLKSAQITIDGTEEVYNKVKNYIYKDDLSPFKTLITNINLLLSYDIVVNIRLNIDKHNIENMKELIKYLYDSFGNLDNLKIYTMPLFECSKEVKRTDEERKEIFQKTVELNNYLDQLGYLSNVFDRSLPNAMCAADDGNSVMILPDGNIGLCEHHTDDEYIATVDSPVFDFAKIKEWKERSPMLDICKDCFLWPTCIKITHCEEQHGCHVYEKELKLNKERKILHNYFKQAKLSEYYLSQLT